MLSCISPSNRVSWELSGTLNCRVAILRYCLSLSPGVARFACVTSRQMLDAAIRAFRIHRVAV
jgi:hypothetical protein